MKKFSKILALLITVSMLITSLPFSFASGGNSDSVLAESYVEGEVLFNYSFGSAKASSLDDLEERLGLKILEKAETQALKSNSSAYSLYDEEDALCRASFDSAKMSVYELCKALNKLPGISDAEPNYTYAADEFVMPSEITSSTLYKNNQKWYFDNMSLTSAWEKYSNLGEGTVVCVIDNGLNFTHNDIKNNLWDDGNCNHGYNAEYNNHDIYGKLENGPAHGSHCAGIIAMEGGNGGMVGVAPKAKIMACNAVTTSSGMFSNFNLIKCLDYATEHGADVISMSLGGYSFSVNMEKALTAASESAVILCAAGNDGLNAADKLHYPSSSSAVIGVMALGSGSAKNTLSSYSNYDLTGRYYQVAAPGTNIYAIASQSDTTYVSMTGTSMATPFMAGLAALYVSEHPELSAPQARRAIIDAAAEMVAGFNNTYTEKPFKKAAPYTLLDESCPAPVSVSIDNETIDTAVREALNVSKSYQLTNYDLESVTWLDLRNSSFKDYSALSSLPKLNSLNLSGTGMTDSDAAVLKNYLPDTLLNFDFSNNELTNLDVFDSYTGYISRLNASGNSISDISGISGFTMLSDLDLSFNDLKDISDVSSLSGTVYLYLPGNKIENPAPVIGMESLEEVYFGNYNPNFTDMFGETYFLSGSAGNKISSLEAFMSLDVNTSRLHYINLSYNFINYDSEFNYRAAKLLQLVSEIAKNNNFESLFEHNSNYKLVLSPFSKESLIFANDIAFNGRNFATIYLDGEGFKIPYSILPEKANAKTGVSFNINDSSVAFVDADGTVYPKAVGSTYITLTLESGRVRTFFITVSDSFVTEARILDEASQYFAQSEYKAVIYTSPVEEIKLTDQNGNSFGTYSSSSKCCYSLTDSHSNSFQKWIVPLYAENAGDYTLTISARAKKSEEFGSAIGTLEFSAKEKFGNELSGIYSRFNSRFDTKISLIASDSTVLQTLTVKGSGTNEGKYKFYGVADGVYSILIESDGYKPYTIENISVSGDTFVDDNIDSGLSFTSFAGDINADSSIDMADISVLLSEQNYTKTFAESNDVLCDINGDNSVDINDLSVIISNIG